MMEQDIINDYTDRVAIAQDEANKYEKLANKYSLQRLIVFAFLIFSIYLSIVQDEISIFIFCFFVAFIWFGWLVNKQNQFDALKKYFDDLKKVNENEIESILNRSNIYYDGSIFLDDKHYYNSDLDIFGKGSLFQLVNRSATSGGNYKLAAWLNVAADKATILLRQEAVKELAEKNDWKLNFQTVLFFVRKQPSDQLKNLVAYLKTTLEIKDEQLLSLYAKVVPYLMLGLVVLCVFYPAARYATSLIALFNFRLVSSKSKTVKLTDLIAGKIGESLSLYAKAFESIENETWQSAYNIKLSDLIKKSGEHAVSGKIKQLSQLINKLNYRLNIVVQVILNIFFIWDIRQVIAIEKWKKDNQESLEIAFDVIAEFETLISLASLKINYSEWCVPQIADGAGYTIIAKNVSHPLINRKNRVANDYELTDTFKVDIITGSNMAGKSTFLRTIGINTVLALSGAPVCADSMKVSVITMISYMRIKDSLNESTSTFKAELDRLQMLLAAVEKDAKVFFLIDEMLRGTNSVDKYLGSKAVIERLISKKAVGMVATHDLQIAQLEQQYPDYVRNFYFDIQVVNGEMLFDYKMKHGECKTFNASLLLKQIGIDIDTN